MRLILLPRCINTGPQQTLRLHSDALLVSADMQQLSNTNHLISLLCNIRI